MAPNSAGEGQNVGSPNQYSAPSTGLWAHKSTPSTPGPSKDGEAELEPQPQHQTEGNVYYARPKPQD